jgi:hypothetical protein
MSINRDFSSYLKDKLKRYLWGKEVGDLFSILSNILIIISIIFFCHDVILQKKIIIIKIVSYINYIIEQKTIA